jgi:hypothetical protein
MEMAVHARMTAPGRTPLTAMNPAIRRDWPQESSSPMPTNSSSVGHFALLTLPGARYVNRARTDT